MIRQFLFGSEKRDGTRIETMTAYTQRVGLLTNTFYVPLISVGLSWRALKNADTIGMPMSKARFAGHLASSFLMTLVVSHTAFYLLQCTLPHQITIVDNPNEGD